MASGAAAHVYFLALGRRSDNAIVLAHEQRPDPEGVSLRERCASVLRQGRWSTVRTDQISLDDGPRMLHVLLHADSNLVFFAITSREYPPRLVVTKGTVGPAGLLMSFRDVIVNGHLREATECAAATGLGRVAKSEVAELAAKFDDVAALDRMTRVAGMVEDVKGVMQENIELALKNTDRLEGIEESAEDLAQSASRFRQGARNVERMMWWRMIKMRILIAFIVLIIALYIIIPIVVTSSKKK